MSSTPWQRPTTWSPRKPVPALRPDAPHVVLSTKFGEPWYTVSVGFKEILEEQGCTVYNPNTDNAEIYGDEANDRWLLTFNENLEKVKESRGFVLQIQQGVVRDKSAMQVAEEKQSGWLNVPRIGVFAFPSTQQRGGSTLGKQYMAQAVEAARRQWAQGVHKDVEMVSEVYEPLDGGAALPLKGISIHGRARCIFPSGHVYEGEFQDGERHGRGKYTFADGNVYEGEYQDGKSHGRGKFTFPNGAVYEGEYQDGKSHGRGKYTYAGGDVYVGFYELGADKGPGVKLSKDRTTAWLLTDGKTEREVSVAKARSKAKELNLPALP